MLPIDSDYAVEGDEAELIEEAQANPLAFDTLYRRYLVRVYRYLRARLESDEDAADLTQQVFLQAFHALPGYEQRGLPFAAWLFQIYWMGNRMMRKRCNCLLTWKGCMLRLVCPFN